MLRRSRRDRLSWYTVRVATGVILLAAAYVWAQRARGYLQGGAVGVDLRHFQVYGRRFLETGSLYLPEQLTGPFPWSPTPYDPNLMPCLYPPPIAYLSVATLVLPPVLWWLLPVGYVAVTIYRWRPQPWTWPLLAVALAQSASVVLAGSSTMLVAALVTGGLARSWPSALIVLKPTFFPFALIGIRTRVWWYAIAVVGLMSLPLIEEWRRYLIVVANAGASPLYAVSEWLICAGPIIAWLGRVNQRPRRRTRDSDAYHDPPALRAR
jgi:hypothetical protein